MSDKKIEEESTFLPSEGKYQGKFLARYIGEFILNNLPEDDLYRDWVIGHIMELLINLRYTFTHAKLKETHKLYSKKWDNLVKVFYDKIVEADKEGTCEDHVLLLLSNTLGENFFAFDIEIKENA